MLMTPLGSASKQAANRNKKRREMKTEQKQMSLFEKLLTHTNIEKQPRTELKKSHKRKPSQMVEAVERSKQEMVGQSQVSTQVSHKAES